MKRLTQKHYGASDYFMACSENCAESVDCTACPSFDSLVDRLGAYEDTGLTPEEINDLTSVREISPEAEYAINKHADSIIDRLDKLLAQTDGDDRLHELAKADKEGRVVVLPCKAGDTVWIIPDGKKFALECEVEYANIGELYATIVLCTKDRLREPYGVATAAFGKTAFLTREEAEEALRRRAEDGKR